MQDIVASHEAGFAEYNESFAHAAGLGEVFPLFLCRSKNNPYLCGQITKNYHEYNNC